MLPTLSVSDFLGSDYAKTYLSLPGSFKISKMFSTFAQVSSGCSHFYRSPGKRWHIAQIFLITVPLLLLAIIIITTTVIKVINSS